MKTPCALENRRLADAMGQHGKPLGGIAQVGVLLHQCFHAFNMHEIPMN
ncbi:MAG: hypothetical protein WC334_03760 [Kiritimatiellales bacterium]|jgi:hypothetical protein